MQADNVDFITAQQREEEEYGQTLKSKFTLEDFLLCEDTREILVNDHSWNFEKNFRPKLEDFYRDLRDDMQGMHATPLYYDRDDSFACVLSAIVYRHIVPEYDLTIFYDSPHLAEPLLEQYDAIKAKKKKEAMEKRRAYYSGNAAPSRKFDWATKAYK